MKALSRQTFERPEIPLHKCALNTSATLFSHLQSIGACKISPKHFAICRRGMLCNRFVLLLSLALSASALAGSTAKADECNSLRHIELNLPPLSAAAPTLEAAELRAQRFGVIAKEFSEHIALLKQVSSRIRSAGETSENACGLQISFELAAPPSTGDKDQLLQAYGITRTNNLVKVTAYTALGALYALYDIFDQMGFRWLSVDDAVVPAVLDFEQIKSSAALKYPKIRWRGFHTYDHAQDENFLYWMARNRLNLIGAATDSNELRHVLGVYGTAGGHDLVPALAGGNVMYEGRRLVEAHPDWYGLPTGAIDSGSQALPGNPCFAHPAFIAHFIDRLAEQVISGRYREADILNIWPADTGILALPELCTKLNGGATDLEQLLKFYAEVEKGLAAKLRSSGIKRDLTISAIGYNDTYSADLDQLQRFRQSQPQVAGDSSQLHLMFVFYPIMRSFSTPLIGPHASSFNSAWGTPLSKALARAPSQGIGIGIVDYLNVSTNMGISSPGTLHLLDELSYYSDRGASLFAYMHPLRTSWGPADLANRMISKLAFDGSDEAPTVVEDYYKRAFGAAAASVEKTMIRYENAVRGRNEMLGVGSSLAMLLRQEVIWHGYMTSKDANSAARLFVQGGHFVPPVIRLGPNVPLDYDLPPLGEAIDEMARCAQELTGLAPGSTPEIARRLDRMVAWIEHSTQIYKALLYLYQWRVAVEEGDIDAQTRLASLFETVILAVRKDPRWANSVTPIGADETIESLFIKIPGPLNSEGKALLGQPPDPQQHAQ